MLALVLAIIPVVIFYLFAQKHIIKGMVEGSIK
jgi:raffinose/stachyose/melibiose transport system permease protein